MTLAILFDAASKSWSKVDIATPEPKPGEILVEVIGCTICGSDLHTVSGRRETPSPIILGHEIVGQIIAFGGDVTPASIDGSPLAVGDRVVWSVVANCEQCYFCDRGLPQKCLAGRKYGHIPFQNSRDLGGGFAEHMLLVPGTKCQKISNEVPLELACPTGCATATAVAAVEASGIQEHDSAMVIGGGLVGLMTCALLRHHGAQTVVCIEPNATRRALAVRFGATHASAQAQLAEWRNATANHGFDTVIECSGQNAAFEDALEVVRFGGKIVLVGAVFPSSPVSVIVERIVRRNLNITGIHNYNPQQLLRAVQFTELFSQTFLPGAIVDRWFDLTDLPNAFTHASKGQPLRVGVRAKAQ